MRVFVTLLIIGCAICSCEKKELPVKKADRGDLITTQIDMGPDYRRQVWFLLNTNTVASVNLKTAWDLALEASAEGYHIFLNGSKAMKIYKTNFDDLAQVTDTAGVGANGKADMPDGDNDSTAIGDWRDHKVYIINRGYNESGLQQGYYKLRIKSVNAAQYMFEYSDMPGASVTQAIVNKDDSYNFNHYSLTDNAQLQVEPKKTEYDLCFTQYTHLFYDPFEYYQVTGVLSNSFNTSVALVTDKAFAYLVIGDTSNYKFEAARNAIGYDWKSFDLNTNLYTVNTTMCYLIRDNKGYYYKLHFIDFLNSSGEKGFPKFEYKKL